jgi:branched-chain amino acid transport system substrate-binding protein
MTLRVFLFTLLLMITPMPRLHAEIKIGWIGPLTGNAAALGVDTVPAIQIAFDEINARGGINGHTLRLIVEDDQYITSKTLSAYRKLVHVDGVQVLFVLTYGGLFAVADQAMRDNILLVDTLDCDEHIARLPANILCIAKTTESMGQGIADQIAAAGDHPSAVIYYDGDPFMGTLYESFKNQLQDKGIRPSLVHTYNESNSDFRSFVTRIKHNKDVKSVVLFGYDQLGRAARMIREAGVNISFYGVNTATSPGFQKLTEGATEGMRGTAFLAPDSEQLEKFRREFIEKTGREWQFETSTIPSYDAAQLIANSLRKLVSAESAALKVTEIRESLLAVRDYIGLSGTITIDKDGATRSIPVRNVVFAGGKAKLAP